MESVYLRSIAVRRAHSQRLDQALSDGNGHWIARLVAGNPRAVQSFPDHEQAAAKLLEDGEFQTLFDVASSGYLDGPRSRIYRKAYAVASGG
jgi:hypothetical protein